MTQTIKYTKENIERHEDFLSDINGYLYVIKLSSKTEEFFKVGVTSKSRVNYRFTEIGKLYTVEVLYLQEGVIPEVFNLEQLFLKEFSEYRYYPNNKFTGHTECLLINPVEHYYNINSYN
jgi:hypothetical protein